MILMLSFFHQLHKNIIHHHRFDGDDGEDKATGMPFALSIG